jgi:hypothetical protein
MALGERPGSAISDVEDGVDQNLYIIVDATWLLPAYLSGTDRLCKLARSLNCDAHTSSSGSGIATSPSGQTRRFRRGIASVIESGNSQAAVKCSEVAQSNYKYGYATQPIKLW